MQEQEQQQQQQLAQLDDEKTPQREDEMPSVRPRLVVDAVS